MKLLVWNLDQASQITFSQLSLQDTPFQEFFETHTENLKQVLAQNKLVNPKAILKTETRSPEFISVTIWKHVATQTRLSNHRIRPWVLIIEHRTFIKTITIANFAY